MSDHVTEGGPGDIFYHKYRDKLKEVARLQEEYTLAVGDYLRTILDLRTLLEWVVGMVEHRAEDMWDEEGFATEELNQFIAQAKEAIKKNPVRL